MSPGRVSPRPISPEHISPGHIQDAASLPEAVYRLYVALSATSPLDAEHGLGGKLLYVGEMGGAGAMAGEGRALLFAANIAGAASLAASGDTVVQRQAIRDGVIDFLVTSLEEALRILKNEIRKRQTVSVGVAMAPDELVEQMLARGVLPDLLPPASWGDGGAGPEPAARLLAQGARRVMAGQDRRAEAYVTWSVQHNFVRWLPRLDAAVEETLPIDDWVRQRWLRQAPRYLGRLVQREHGVALSGDEVTRLRSVMLELRGQHLTDAGGVPAMWIGGVPVG